MHQKPATRCLVYFLIFIGIIQRISALVEAAPEIVEMDINPLIANSEHSVAVDVRIKIEKLPPC